jgi:cytochrome c oxidase subunit IV
VPSLNGKKQISVKNIFLKILGVILVLSALHNVIAYFGTEPYQIIRFALGLAYGIAGIYILDTVTKKAHT